MKPICEECDDREPGRSHLNQAVLLAVSDESDTDENSQCEAGNHCKAPPFQARHSDLVRRFSHVV
jgi:hypothetical protein